MNLCHHRKTYTCILYPKDIYIYISINIMFKQQITHTPFCFADSHEVPHPHLMVTILSGGLGDDVGLDLHRCPASKAKWGSPLPSSKSWGKTMENI